MLKFNFRGIAVYILRIFLPLVTNRYQLVEIPTKAEFFFYDLLHKVEKCDDNRVWEKNTILKLLLDVEEQEKIFLKEEGKKGTAN